MANPRHGVTRLGDAHHSASVSALPDNSCMRCKSCDSENVRKLIGEITLTSRALKNLVEPPVYVRSEVVACLDCGAAQFVIQEAELRLLGEVNGPER